MGSSSFRLSLGGPNHHSDMPQTLKMRHAMTFFIKKMHQENAPRQQKTSRKCTKKKPLHALSSDDVENMSRGSEA
jgi:hypothetical protein